MWASNVFMCVFRAGREVLFLLILRLPTVVYGLVTGAMQDMCGGKLSYVGCKEGASCQTYSLWLSTNVV